jgi:predicted nucleic acid-binding protein
MIAKYGLLDTSVLIAVESNRPLDHALLPLNQIVSVISVAELHAGVHASPTPESRSIRMATLEAIAGLTLLGVDGTAASHWGRLRFRLAEAGRKVNVNDLWIASIALANSLPVITQDRDFDVFADFGGPVVIHV